MSVSEWASSECVCIPVAVITGYQLNCGCYAIGPFGSTTHRLRCKLNRFFSVCVCVCVAYLSVLSCCF